MAGNRKSYKKQNDSSSKQEKKSLPYDFIPFPDKWKYVYQEPFDNRADTSNRNKLPKHDQIKGLSGRIDYRIIPQTDLAMDFRKVGDTKYQVSGSNTRGKVRSNLEILSASYPSFVDKVDLTYRDIAGGLSKKYMDKLKGGRYGDIARNIYAGFLKKEGNTFYVEAAEQIGNLNFRSKFEDELIESMGQGSFSNLFQWDDKSKNNIISMRKQINKLTKEINDTKKKYKTESESISKYDIKKFRDISKERDRIFKSKARFTWRFTRYKVNSPYKKTQAISELERDLRNELRKININLQEINNFHDKYIERIKLKAEIYIDYMNMKKNNRFRPYQMEAEYGWKDEINCQEVRKRGSQIQKEQKYEKVYLYNSTNASSKKSHYIIKPADDPEQLEVSQDLVISYNEMLKNFKVSPERGNNSKNQGDIDSHQSTTKDFYDIFSNYEDLIKSNPEGVIVFYRLDKGEIKNISRTPYLRVSYEKQIKELIYSKLEKSNGDELRIDYARALFGYVANDFASEYDPDKIKDIQSYKSRLRFSALEIESKDKNALELVNNFTLMSPAYSAFGMYINQDDPTRIKTYEDSDIEVNGYKYYKMFEKNIKPDQNDSASYKCSKVILPKEKVEKMTASIYFENLSDEELGLLILSLDINQIVDREWIQIDEKQENEYFDSIGGAKPYGYGCVKVNIENMKIDCMGEKPVDIDDWIGHDEDIESKEGNLDLEKYILAAMEKDIISEKTLGYYLTSKRKQGNVSSVNWENLSSGKNNAAGYPKNWIIEKQRAKIINIDSELINKLWRENKARAENKKIEQQQKRVKKKQKMQEELRSQESKKSSKLEKIENEENSEEKESTKSADDIFVVGFELTNKDDYIDSRKSMKYWITASKIVEFVENKLPEQILKNMHWNFKKIWTLSKRDEYVIDGFVEAYEDIYDVEDIQCNYFVDERLLIFKDKKYAESFNKELSKYILEKFDNLKLVAISAKESISEKKLNEYINFEISDIELEDKLRSILAKVERKIKAELLSKKLKNGNELSLKNFGVYQKCIYSGKSAGYIDYSTKNYISKEYHDLDGFNNDYIEFSSNNIDDSIKASRDSYYAIAYFDGDRILKSLKRALYPEKENKNDPDIDEFYQYVYGYINEPLQKNEYKEKSDKEKDSPNLRFIDKFYFTQNYKQNSRVAILNLDELFEFTDEVDETLNIDFVESFLIYEDYDKGEEEYVNLKLREATKNINIKSFYNKISVVIAEKTMPFGRAINLAESIFSEPQEVSGENFYIDMEIMTSRSISSILAGKSKPVRYEIQNFRRLQSALDSVRSLDIKKRTNEEVQRQLAKADLEIDVEKQIYQLIDMSQQIEHEDIQKENEEW
jgi:CRISPR-associated protein (TIGR03986 family)